MYSIQSRAPDPGCGAPEQMGASKAGGGLGTVPRGTPPRRGPVPALRDEHPPGPQARRANSPRQPGREPTADSGYRSRTRRPRGFDHHRKRSRNPPGSQMPLRPELRTYPAVPAQTGMDGSGQRLVPAEFHVERWRSTGITLQAQPFTHRPYDQTPPNSRAATHVVSHLVCCTRNVRLSWQAGRSSGLVPASLEG